MSWELEPAVLRKLTAAGWSPTRRVDPAPFTDPLVRLGLPVVPIALDVLRSFGGLIWEPDDMTVASYIRVGFGGPRDRHDVSAESVNHLRDLVEEDVTPVGGFGDWRIFLGGSEDAYCLDLQWFGLLGMNCFEGVLDHASGLYAEVEEIGLPDEKKPPRYRGLV